ncbi:unnamed protein product, partial [marine sediment metagenome]
MLGKKSFIQIAKNEEKLTGRAFAIAGVIISGVCLTLILIALFYP